MVVEVLSRHLINFELKIDNKVSIPHSNLLVISTRMNRFMVKQILIDTGSFVNLIMLMVFEKLGLEKDFQKSCIP